MNDVLTLSDILSRLDTVEWHEAVAVVRGVTEVLLRQTATRQSIPEPHQIRISPARDINLTGGTSGQEPVRRLGQLLQVTLGASEPPVQLRLMISQATAPMPMYASVSEFDKALGYFERPGRAAIIQGLHQRAAQLPARAMTRAVPTLDEFAPLPASDAAPRPAVKKRSRSQGRAGWVAAAAVVVAALGTAAAKSNARSWTFAGASQRLMATASRGGDAIGSALVTGVSLVTERIGLGRLVSANTGGAGAATPSTGTSTPSAPAPTAGKHHDLAPSRTPPTVSAARRNSAAETKPVAEVEAPTLQLHAASVPFAAFDLEPLPGPLPRVHFHEDETIVVPVGRIDPDAAADSAPIFALGSEGVMAPVAVRPQLPRELPPTVKRSDLRLIELIISPFGTVESVKLLGQPRNVHDSMLLSAVKAWEFIPALKDGVAVRYRKTITIAPRN